jgi:hypothetical protein
MANFDTSTSKRQSVQRANNLLANIQSAYNAMKIVQGLMTLYQSSSDPVFNAAVNALFTVAERTEIAAMLTGVNTLVTDWESNHSAAIQD